MSATNTATCWFSCTLQEFLACPFPLLDGSAYPPSEIMIAPPHIDRSQINSLSPERQKINRGEAGVVFAPLCFSHHTRNNMAQNFAELRPYVPLMVRLTCQRGEISRTRFVYPQLLTAASNRALRRPPHRAARVCRDGRPRPVDSPEPPDRPPHQMLAQMLSSSA